MTRRRGGLAEDVAGYLRAKILSGEMKPGEKVDQDAIGEALGVSRSPVREGIIVLGQEGLLDVLPRRGAVVAKLTRDDVIDHYELFGLISGRVAAQAADELTDADLVELRMIHDRFVDAIGDEHEKLNDEFHRIINASASRRTRWLLRHLERSIPEGFYGITPGWGQTAVVGHDRVMAALEARDPRAARAAMEQHLHDAGVAAVHALEANGFWEDTPA